MSKELLPCPFCGGPAELTGFKAPEFWVRCPAIGCKASTEGFGSKERAIQAWNTRTSHLPEEVARVIYPEAFEEPTPHASTVYRCMAYHEARADALERADRILSLKNPTAKRAGE